MHLEIGPQHRYPTQNTTAASVWQHLAQEACAIAAYFHARVCAHAPPPPWASLHAVLLSPPSSHPPSTRPPPSAVIDPSGMLTRWPPAGSRRRSPDHRLRAAPQPAPDGRGVGGCAVVCSCWHRGRVGSSSWVGRNPRGGGAPPSSCGPVLAWDVVDDPGERAYNCSDESTELSPPVVMTNRERLMMGTTSAACTVFACLFLMLAPQMPVGGRASGDDDALS